MKSLTNLVMSLLVIAALFVTMVTATIASDVGRTNVKQAAKVAKLPVAPVQAIRLDNLILNEKTITEQPTIYAKQNPGATRSTTRVRATVSKAIILRE